ncbi:CocE/NonD family hydrolase [soil metagenome]
MTIRTTFPHEIEVIEHLWIPLSDGTRLAARVWMPADARDNPIPAILEYLPYRLTDGTNERDALQHPYFAGHGYASVRVDMRGSGNSTGIMYDEYLKQEQDDALEILAWLAAQPWCDGNVGIIGISWGGFNGLQIAARRPPELKAVITLCSTDDRYADDVHYIGGCLSAADQLSWASTMLLYNAKPPLPWIVGEDWREIWFDRMDRTPPWIDAWMTHQRRDEFWQHGSICEDYSEVECPVFAVGGWSDGYTNAIMRMLKHLPRPRKGLIGPWAHAYPEIARPGPQIGFLQECLRWWDRWLKGIDTGVESDSMLRAWMPDALVPAPDYEAWPGRWVAEEEWPSVRVFPMNLHLGADGRLASDPTGSQSLAVPGSLLHGKHAGHWCPYGAPGDYPIDQRQEDALCRTFDSEPLAEAVEILGYPELHLRITADKPQALLAARLCDVWPDGRSTLITRGLLNLTHRDSHEHPEPLEPGQEYDVTLKLNAAAWSLPPGHRLRLALSSTYWPWAWPSPEPVAMTIESGEQARLDLPVRPQLDIEDPVSFAEPETATPAEVDRVSPPERDWTIAFDPITGRQSITIDDRQAKRYVDQDLEIRTASRIDWSIRDGDPLSAANTVENSWHARRGNWDVRVQTRSTLSADQEHFHITTLVEAFEGETRVSTRTHSNRIPRDNV